jgi:hypothetical protein
MPNLFRELHRANCLPSLAFSERRSRTLQISEGVGARKQKVAEDRSPCVIREIWSMTGDSLQVVRFRPKFQVNTRLVFG